jgi:2-polyprenyl-6-methoxyphenol hydroxylase-like FAD-dependent oxidoreductase
MTGGLPEECIALFGKISDRDLQDQPIWDMDTLTTFQCQRMALMGDAAHPMPPYCGQRIAMALEDALALGVILEPDTPLDEIEDRLKLYSRTRKQRAEAVQQTTRGLSEADMRNFATDFDSKCDCIWPAEKMLTCDSCVFSHLYSRT